MATQYTDTGYDIAGGSAQTDIWQRIYELLLATQNQDISRYGQMGTVPVVLDEGRDYANEINTAFLEMEKTQGRKRGPNQIGLWEYWLPIAKSVTGLPEAVLKQVYDDQAKLPPGSYSPERFNTMLVNASKTAIPSLQKQMAEWNQGMQLMQLASSLRGPENYFQYTNMLRGAEGSPQLEFARKIAGGENLSSFGNWGQGTPATVAGLLGQGQGTPAATTGAITPTTTTPLATPGGLPGTDYDEATARAYNDALTRMGKMTMDFVLPPAGWKIGDPITAGMRGVPATPTTPVGNAAYPDDMNRGPFPPGFAPQGTPQPLTPTPTTGMPAMPGPVGTDQTSALMARLFGAAGDSGAGSYPIGIGRPQPGDLAPTMPGPMTSKPLGPGPVSPGEPVPTLTPAPATPSTGLDPQRDYAAAIEAAYAAYEAVNGRQRGPNGIGLPDLWLKIARGVTGLPDAVLGNVYNQQAQLAPGTYNPTWFNTTLRNAAKATPTPIVEPVQTPTPAPPGVGSDYGIGRTTEPGSDWGPRAGGPRAGVEPVPTTSAVPITAPHKVKISQATRMLPTERSMYNSALEAGGYEPNDYWELVKRAAPRGEANRMTRWR